MRCKRLEFIEAVYAQVVLRHLVYLWCLFISYFVRGSRVCMLGIRWWDSHTCIRDVVVQGIAAPVFIYDLLKRHGPDVNLRIPLGKLIGGF